MVLCGTLKTYKRRIYDTTRTLNCPGRRPPPTCPFIQPTMRKSRSTVSLRQRKSHTAQFPALTERPEQCFFRDPVANPLVRLGVGGGLWASSQTPSTSFFKFSAGRSCSNSKPGPKPQTFNLPCLKGLGCRRAVGVEGVSEEPNCPPPGVVI